MSLQTSGAISLANIQSEFGGSNPISMSEYYRGGSYTTGNNTNVPTSGAISIGNFYGGIAFAVSGGTYYESGGYAYVKMTSSGYLTVAGSNTIQYIVVGGGAGGSNARGTGGEGGRVTTGTTTIGSGSHYVTIGGGGAGEYGSSCHGSDLHPGGTSSLGSIASATGGVYSRCDIGCSYGVGANGTQWVDGNYYGGWGGGGCDGYGFAGGLGGGGQGTGTNGGAGTNGLGGGGGGTGYGKYTSGAGGSGVVIIRWAL